MTIPSWKLLAQLDHLHDMQARLNSEATEAALKKSEHRHLNERDQGSREDEPAHEGHVWV